MIGVGNVSVLYAGSIGSDGRGGIGGGCNGYRGFNRVEAVVMVRAAGVMVLAVERRARCWQRRPGESSGGRYGVSRSGGLMENHPNIIPLAHALSGF